MASAAERNRAIELLLKTGKFREHRILLAVLGELSASNCTVDALRRWSAERARSISLSARKICTVPFGSHHSGQSEHGFDNLLRIVQVAGALGPLLGNFRIVLLV